MVHQIKFFFKLTFLVCLIFTFNNINAQENNNYSSDSTFKGAFRTKEITPYKKVVPFHEWALTPPMGWNSWDCFGSTVTEAEVKENVDYMAKNLSKVGWEYIVIDIRWYVSNDKPHGYNELNPVFTIDKFGRYLPAANRFPSSSNGQGFKPIADYIHKKGLKFGIHIMRGIPTLAVKNNTIIEGTNFTAAQIYSPSDQSIWLHDNYTIDATKPGAQEYYNSIFKLYASWGLDFVKVDDLTAPYHREEVELIRKAIDKTGRKIVLSTSPGETPVQDADHVQNNANMWRTVGDFWDNWLQLKEHFDVFERWNKWRIKGGYPDGDMLPIGRIGIRAEHGDSRMSGFSRNEQYTLLTLWSIFKSPLMLGGHLPGNDPFTLSLLTNKEMLNVLNNSTNNKQIFKTPSVAVWAADDTKSSDKYLAVFNIEDQLMAVDCKALWKSPIISRKANRSEVSTDLNITHAKKLYLVVTDGGDNIDWDHADWISPTIYNDKDSLLLTTLNWTNAISGLEAPKKNMSISQTKLIVNGVSYENGIGTHANSIIEYDLPEGFTRFKTIAGLDNAATAQKAGATVQFMVFTENPAGLVPSDSLKVPIKLSSIGINSSCSITDIWTGEKLGEFSNEFAPVIPRHGCGYYKISVKTNQ